MTKDDITRAVKEAVEATVPPVVERVVNGKINKIQSTLDSHIETVRPVIDFLNTANSINRFVKWGKGGLFVLIGVAALVIHKLLKS